MTNAKELYDAAILIKESCKNARPKNQRCILENGEVCPFNCCESGLGLCSLSEDREPICWNIKKPRLFTNEEVNLAKSLKSIGAVSAKRTSHDICFYDQNHKCLSAISLDFFSAVGESEILVDEIIKDGD